MTKLIKPIAVVLFVFLSVSSGFSQCNPTYDSSNLCANSAIFFKANAPGFTTYDWTFGTLGTSQKRDPSFYFSVPGKHRIKFEASGVAGTCSKTFTVDIKASPKIDVRRINDTVQCFAQNEFCFTDFTTPVQSTKQQIYEFSDGYKHEVDTPSYPYSFCHTIIDPIGASINLKVTSIDKNGCTSIRTYYNFMQVYPKVHISISSNGPVGCDSTKATITNKSTVDFNRIATFCWDFGDSTIVCGDSNTNLDYWEGVKKDGVIEKKYTQYGTFNVSLSVTTKKGCKVKYNYKSAATNFGFNPEILSDKDTFASHEAVSFKQLYGPIVGARFLWNFGDPISGPENTNDQTWIPSHVYSSLGPKMISIRIVYGPCDRTVFDTVFIQGPLAVIEAPYNRIKEKEKYQCKLSDTVHFTNNSSFWRNDASPTNEDSVVTVNSEKRFVFNYNETTKSGDQTAITSASHESSRLMGKQIFRLWNFGDKYADQCTTSTNLNINIGKNCNYSTDNLPVHKYQNWDSVYYNQYFARNDTFYHVTASNGKCDNVLVDTNSKALHRYIFRKTISHNYLANLYLKDTISGFESIDYVDIVGIEPDASRMTIQSGNLCPIDGNNLNHYITFDLNTGGQPYFAVNFDSAANPNNFIVSNSGGILAPPAPGSPIPFVLPYDIAGAIPQQFVKGFTQGELGANTTKKVNSVGLIVGNGPLGSNGEPPTCLDTAWYHNLLNFNVLHAGFEVLGGKTTTSFCKGDTVYIKPNKKLQSGIKHLRWNWGDQEHIDMYYEEFKSLEKYTGPSANRNDKDVVYKGENWLYNYVVRHEYDDVYGDVVLDTIVTAIIKDYWLDCIGIPVYRDNAPGMLVQPIPKNEMYKYIGTCLDTTGLSQFFVPREFRESAGGLVFEKGGKRYRYTDGSKKDSVEVSLILHFRDSTIQGFDTAIIGTDTIPGVWRHIYTDAIVETNNGKKDTVLTNASGGMNPSLYLSNMEDCQVTSTERITVGFSLNAVLLNDAVCQSDVVEIDDSIRYWQTDDKTFPNDYPIDPRRFWESPVRYANGKLEIKSVDWDASDGIGNDKNRSINFFHQYQTPGEYTITMFARDSLGCLDTAQVTADITGIRANFETKRNTANPCSPVFTFSDSTIVYSTTDADSIIWHEWYFGDGSQKSILKNPTHTYRRFGWRTVKHKAYSKLGCVDSLAKQLYVAGPVPEFEFKDNAWWNFLDSATIYVGDTLELKNTSHDPMHSPQFILDWGDNYTTATTDINEVFKHAYTRDGIYYPNLFMEDTLDQTTERCFSYFPTGDSTWTPSRDIVVFVRPDTTNSVSQLIPFASVFPNPNTGSFNITTLANNRILAIDLTNVFGQKIAFHVKKIGDNRVEVDANFLNTGNYFLILNTEQGTIRKKITIVN